MTITVAGNKKEYEDGLNITTLWKKKMWKIRYMLPLR